MFYDNDSSLANIMIYRTEPNGLRIQTLNSSTIVPVFLRLTEELFGQEYCDRIIGVMKKSPEYFERSAVDLETSQSLKATYNANRALEDGKPLEIENMHRYFLIWWIISAILKTPSHQTQQQQSTKRIAAICGMANAAAFTFSWEAADFAGFVKLKMALKLVVPEVVKALYAESIVGENVTSKKWRAYVASMLHGYEMSSFNAIREYWNSPYTLAARANNNLRTEWQEFERMEQAIQNAIPGYPVGVYRLLCPNGRLADTAKIKSLRYAAIDWVKSRPDSTWGNFATIPDRGVDCASIKHLNSQADGENPAKRMKLADLFFRL